jgi:uncharacterized protein YebE (UPF0316 family)
VTSGEASALIEHLKAEDYGVTSVNAQGARGDVSLIYTIFKRSYLDHVIEIINRYNPRAFYTIEDVRFAREGIFREGGTSWVKSYLAHLRFWRKGK